MIGTQILEESLQEERVMIDSLTNCYPGTIINTS